LLHRIDDRRQNVGLRLCKWDEKLRAERKLDNLRVLVAEDSAFFREAVKRGLHDIVKSLDIANDGEAAWQLLQKGSYDLVITDIEMPRLNGLELAERIRGDSRFKGLPIIALSARQELDIKEKARLVGINRYETKLDRERLCLAITDVLHPH
jgi:two-component system chemotaxis sensor kinase CheA